jgi:hypothetical protein
MSVIHCLCLSAREYPGLRPLWNNLARILPFDRAGTTLARSALANSRSQEWLSWQRAARPPASSRILPMPAVPIPAIRTRSP